MSVKAKACNYYVYYSAFKIRKYKNCSVTHVMVSANIFFRFHPLSFPPVLTLTSSTLTLCWFCLGAFCECTHYDWFANRTFNSHNRLNPRAASVTHRWMNCGNCWVKLFGISTNTCNQFYTEQHITTIHHQPFMAEG